MKFRSLLCILLLIPVFFLMAAPIAASAQTQPGLVRVKLIEQADSLGFMVSGNYQLVDQYTGQLIVKLKPGEKWQVALENGRIALIGPGGAKSIYKGPVSAEAQTFQAYILSGSGTKVNMESISDLSVINGDGKKLSLAQPEGGISVRGPKGVVTLGGSGDLSLISLINGADTITYRGGLEFRFDGGKLTAINTVNIEDYLCGVVPYECYASWPIETLKAQAVAARNYAVQMVEASGGSSYNLVAGTSNQAYGGYDAETPATNKAVRDTSGIVMLCQGKVITAFFHSSSGGFTENSEDVWLNPLPYIKWKPDPYDKNNIHYNWQVVYTNDQLAEKLTKAGYPITKITDIKIKERTLSGARVKKIALTGIGAAGKAVSYEIYNANNLRSALGLKSSLITISNTYNKDKSLAGIKITGSGNGHGLGMSQYGAYGMATQGYNYQDILKYYYSGVTLSNNYGGVPSMAAAGD